MIIFAGLNAQPPDDLKVSLRALETRFDRVRLIDSRSKRTSMNTPAYRGDLRDITPETMSYTWISALGGHPDEPSLYDIHNRIDYRKLATLPKTSAALETLNKQNLPNTATVVVCTCANHGQCHRINLVARELLDRGANPDEMALLGPGGALMPVPPRSSMLERSNVAIEPKQRAPIVEPVTHQAARPNSPMQPVETRASLRNSEPFQRVTPEKLLQAAKEQAGEITKLREVPSPHHAITTLLARAVYEHLRAPSDDVTYDLAAPITIDVGSIPEWENALRITRSAEQLALVDASGTTVLYDTQAGAASDVDTNPAMPKWRAVANALVELGALDERGVAVVGAMLGTQQAASPEHVPQDTVDKIYTSPKSQVRLARLANRTKVGIDKEAQVIASALDARLQEHSSIVALVPTSISDHPAITEIAKKHNVTLSSHNSPGNSIGQTALLLDAYERNDMLTVASIINEHPEATIHFGHDRLDPAAQHPTIAKMYVKLIQEADRTARAELTERQQTHDISQAQTQDR